MAMPATSLLAQENGVRFLTAWGTNYRREFCKMEANVMAGRKYEPQRGSEL